jgi:hypothetical protein
MGKTAGVTSEVISLPNGGHSVRHHPCGSYTSMASLGRASLTTTSPTSPGQGDSSAAAA